MIKENLAYIDSLKNELSRISPQEKDIERLSKKFQLEWNYNSNHLEGNTFTLKDTELLLIFKEDDQSYSFREKAEMKAHDAAIQLVELLAKSKERQLNETFISQLNEIILVKSYWKENSHGRFQVIPGRYKKNPNSVLRKETGEIFQFASPEKVQGLMGDLMDFYRIHSASTETHPVWLAAMMHYKFVQIHPFDDGNGRIARLLMNYCLLKNHYPPVIIKSKEKNKYLHALNRADDGDEESFVLYIIQQLHWSLDLSIAAYQGKNIEEDEDLTKRVSILKKSVQSKAKIITKKESVVKKVVNEFYIPFLKRLNEKLIEIEIENLFERTSWNLVDNSLESDKIEENLVKSLRSRRIPMKFDKLINEIEAKNDSGQDYGYEVFKDFVNFNTEDTSFDLSISVNIIFRERYFHIETYIGTIKDNNELSRTLLLFLDKQKKINNLEHQKIFYNQNLEENQIQQIVREIGNCTINFVESKAAELDKNRN